MDTSEIIGRKKEKRILAGLLESDKPEFVAVYGRRRVGKTFLIKEYFSNRFSFYSTGVASGKSKTKLRSFYMSLYRHGLSQSKKAKDWFDAFSCLQELLEQPYCYREVTHHKRVVFLDELPWMDSPRSDFKAALDFFWNSYGSTQNDLILIVCGSATSWIINNVVKDSGGFYNRLTNQIHLLPFHLKECYELSCLLRLGFNKETVMRAYMVFGGIPYYWKLFDRRLSLEQNIQALCFEEDGQLRREYVTLFSSLFSAKGEHRLVMSIIAQKKCGITRNDLLKVKEIKGGRPLSQALEELEECGFIRKYSNQKCAHNNSFYQLIDPFLSFSFSFLVDDKVTSWTKYFTKPTYFSWLGYAFELLCLNHIAEIKEDLSIGGIETREYSFRSTSSSPGAQIDLCIDRADGVIDICEMKYGAEPFLLTADYIVSLSRKMEVFRNESKTKSSLHLVLVSPYGIEGNGELVNNVVTADAFF